MKRGIKLAASAVSTAAWLAFVFGNSLKSRSASAAQSDKAVGLLARLLAALGIDGDMEAVATLAVRKAAHIFEFFVLYLLFAALFTLLFGTKKAVPLAAVAALVCACIDEGLQIISHRGASVRDVLIDLVGVAVGAGVLYLIRRNSERIERHRTQKKHNRH